MFSQIVKSVPDPCKLPDFMKQKGGQSRPLAITDFVKPVRSANEKSLNHELYLLHTKKKRTDRLGFCRDFKLRVVTIWRQTQTLCNTYLKCEEHLQLHEKEIVSQASHAEVVHTTSVTGGLPAEQPSFCQPPLQLQPPRDDPATRKGALAAKNGHEGLVGGGGGVWRTDGEQTRHWVGILEHPHLC
ncbi:MAG: hypothetical protein FRX49_01922 [Trebouxia sp. A1-2]|nr:MAG: hypothetical protein FRX49_01922 [Trebouxia sp. A1-2]